MASELNFPRLLSLKLTDFDLYSYEPSSLTSFEKSVFCLVGANGLGKTTYLNSLVYAITGVVPNFRKKYLSDTKYYKENSQSDRISDYFDGRISEEYRETSGVSVCLRWPQKTVTVTRGLFGASEIRELEVTDNQSGEVETFSGGDDLKRAYAKQVVELTGLKEFSQFVFLVHYVWTFGEDRHLLMWDETALTDALFLGFGGNPTEAQQASKLRTARDRAASNARNRKYAAKQLSDRMKILQDLVKKAETDDDDESIEELDSLRATYDELVAAVEEKEDRLDRKREALQDIDVKWADLSSSLSETQIEYQRVFSAHFQNTSSVHHHPIIKATISEDECSICHSRGVSAAVKSLIDENKCPLCGSEVSASDPNDGRETLKKLDALISSLQDNNKKILQTRSRLSAEYEAAEASLAASKDALREFEDAKPEELKHDTRDVSTETLIQELKSLRRDHEALSQESRDLYKKRDEYRKQLKEIEEKLKFAYEAGATVFVPRFRELAEEFIGFPIDVQLTENKNSNKSGFGLILRMNDEVRLTSDTVSESQGFFIDIALRMSLAEYMSETPATLIVDTPEGSLDIAYEARAGAMFSKFAGAKNSIVMTANLRSSELVLRLAERQTHDNMLVARMTEWTELSDVQKEEEGLFQEAYDRIDEALSGATS